MYIDAAYCYTWGKVVCLSIIFFGRSVSVGHNSEPCKNSWTDRYAIWDVDSGAWESYIRWGSEPFLWRGNSEGEMERPIGKYGDCLP